LRSNHDRLKQACRSSIDLKKNKPRRNEENEEIAQGFPCFFPTSSCSSSLRGDILILEIYSFNLNFGMPVSLAMTRQALPCQPKLREQHDETTGLESYTCVAMRVAQDARATRANA
jgi:hypothetical protein